MFGSKTIRINRQAKIIEQQKKTIEQKEDIIEKQKTVSRKIENIIQNAKRDKTPSVIVVDKIKEAIAVHCK